MNQTLRCPCCRAEVRVQEYLCLHTGDPVSKVRCPSCRKVWATLVDFLRVREYEEAAQDMPKQVCPACGHDASPDPLWAGLSHGAVICPDCFRCPGCSGVVFRREADRVVCEACGSNWHDGMEFAHDFLPKAHILQ